MEKKENGTDTRLHIPAITHDSRSRFLQCLQRHDGDFTFDDMTDLADELYPHVDNNRDDSTMTPTDGTTTTTIMKRKRVPQKRVPLILVFLCFKRGKMLRPETSNSKHAFEQKK